MHLWNSLFSATTDASEPVFDLITTLTAVTIGLFAGLIICFIIRLLAKFLARKELFTRLLLRRLNHSLYFTFALLGAYIGVRYAISGITLTTLISGLIHGLVILLIAAVATVLAKAVAVIEDLARLKAGNKGKRKRNRLITQAQVVRRILQVVIIVVGVVSAVLTFPEAQIAMSSILASAGVASIVATMAAQSTLANVFAGVQLAMSDAIRVGDIIQVPGLESTKEIGTVEEITLTYVVISLYDERRMIVPSTQFTQGKFENWTRKHPRQLGTVEFILDYSTPVPLLRARADELLRHTHLWDGRKAALDVTDMTRDSITVRLLVSAKDSADLWQLRCYLREEMISWIYEEIPWALVSERIKASDNGMTANLKENLYSQIGIDLKAPAAVSAEQESVSEKHSDSTSDKVKLTAKSDDKVDSSN